MSAVNDPLLPATQLLETVKPAAQLIEAVNRPYPRRHRDDDWPRLPVDPSVAHLRPGLVALVRSRWGTWRKLRVRVVNRSNSRIKRGQFYFVGDDRDGRCHSAWIDRVVSVEPVTSAAMLKVKGKGPILRP